MKKCNRCDFEFDPITYNHIYCSYSCKEIQSKIDKRLKYSNFSQFKKDEINKKQRKKRQKKVYPPIDCRYCKKAFTPKTTVNIYCSKICSNFINKKLRNNLRSRLNKAVSKKYKSGSAVNDLGCSIEEFKIYIENQFQDGMSWDNWSRTGWHVDHIKALATFDLTNRDELLKAVHYTNLQPLWAKDNLSKGVKGE